MDKSAYRTEGLGNSTLQNMNVIKQENHTVLPERDRRKVCVGKKVFVAQSCPTLSDDLLSESLVLCSPTCLPGRHFRYFVSTPSLHIGSDGKESACDAGDLGLIPGLGRSPAEGNGNPLQYFCLENAMDRGAWQATVHGVAKSWTRLRE